MKRITLALLVDVLEDIKGGAERQIYEFLRNVNKEKFRVFLFVLHQKIVPSLIKEVEENAVGLEIKRIYDKDAIKKGVKFFRFLKQKKIDILMTYHFASDIWGTIFAKLAGVPLVISNRRDAGFWRKKIHIWAYRLVDRWVNKIIVVSRAVKEVVLNTEQISPHKVEVIYNGVDIGRFEKDIDKEFKKRELGLKEGYKIVGCIGNLRPIKGHKFLIEAIPNILHKFPNTYFLFIGEGELRREFQSRIKELGIEKNVYFLGKRDDVTELIAIMDICVLPSLSEGLSNVLLEYMASSKPVIATCVGGNQEVIEDEENGILVPPCDSNSLAKEIINLLEKEDFARKLGEEAKKTVKERFNLENQIKHMENFLEEELNKKESNEHRYKKEKEKLKVMHLISSNGVFGAEKVMLNLAERMNNNRVRSYIVAIKNLHNPHLEVVKIAKERGIPASFVVCRGKFDLGSLFSLYKFVKEEKIDIIHTHNYKANFLAAFIAKLLKIPIVATNHLWTSSNLKLKIYEFIDALIMRYFVDKVIAVSESIKKDMVRRFVPCRKIKLIFNGIEIKNNGLEKGIREKLKIERDQVVIGIIARLYPEKGHRYFLEAVPKIIKRNQNIIFLIVGDGPLREDLENQVKVLGVEKFVYFLGYQEKIESVYKGIDILLQPSLREGLPLTILEAMSFGKAVIATDVGGVKNLVKDNLTGLLIKPASSDEIYKALLVLINNSFLRKRLGENARRFVQDNYSIEKMVEEYKEVYKEVVKR